MAPATSVEGSGRPPADLPALFGEDHACEVCHLSYPEVTVDAATELMRSLPARYDAAVGSVQGDLLRWRPPGGGWSVTEYTCHVRDVYATYMIRLHRARNEHEPAVEPLFGDLRADRLRYNDREMSAVLGELHANVAGFCEEIATVRANEWDRVVTRLPTERRTALWLVRQAMHEGEHHLHDVRRVLAAATDRG
jgi:DinB superfamily